MEISCLLYELMLDGLNTISNMIMPKNNQSKTPIKRVLHQFFQGMLPRRCRNNNKRRKKEEDESNLNTFVDATEQRQRQRLKVEETSNTTSDHHMTSPCSSPKKRREVRFTLDEVVDGDDSNTAILLPLAAALPPQQFQNILDSPLIIDRDHHRNFQQTTPPVMKSIYSPPHLQQRDSRIAVPGGGIQHNNDGIIPLPSLPSDLINDIDGSMAPPTPKFRLNPRLQWNTEMISEQINGNEKTLSSLLMNDEHMIDGPIKINIRPPSPPPNIISKVVRDISENVNNIECGVMTEDVIKPIPRYGSAQVGILSGEATVDCDNTNTTLMNTVTETTLTNTVGDTTLMDTVIEEPCCSFFHPSWTSAFDMIDPRDHKREK